MSSKIRVKLDVLGTHSWPGAYGEVEFLKHEHHHQFNFVIETDVNHDNRAIEFIMLRMDVLDLIYEKYPTDRWIVKFGERSCEMIANEIQEELEEEYGQDMKVSVFEDDVQGGVVE